MNAIDLDDVSREIAASAAAKCGRDPAVVSHAVRTIIWRRFGHQTAETPECTGLGWWITNLCQAALWWSIWAFLSRVTGVSL